MRDTTSAARRWAGITTAALAFSGGTVIAGVNVWTSHGPGGGDITALLVDPRHPSTVFAGLRGAGVFRSDDAAASWNAVGSGAAAVVTGLSIDTAGRLYVSADGRLLASADGASWEAIPIPGAGTIRSVLADARSSGTLYALADSVCSPTTCSGGGFYRSADGGETWSHLRSELLTSLVQDGASGTLYGTSGSMDVFRISSGGSSWTKISDGLRGWFYKIGLDSRGTLYVASSKLCGFGLCTDGGLFRSTDGGSHWSETGTPRAGGIDGPFFLDPGSGTLYVGGTTSLWMSTDGGRSWAAADLGGQLQAMAFDRSRPGRAYAGTSDELLVSEDGGARWEKATSGLGGTRIVSLASDPRTADVLYAAVGRNLVSPGHRSNLFKSSDGGESWSPTGLDEFALEVVVDPAAPGSVYALVDNYPWISDDGGASWRRFRGELPSGVLHLAASPGPRALYAITTASISRSDDGGATFVSLASGMFLDAELRSLAIDPRNPAVLYLGSAKGIYRSEDRGETWMLWSAEFAGMARLSFAFDPTDPATMYAAPADFDPNTSSGVFKSADGGVTWQGASQGLPTSNDGLIEIQDLAADPVHPGTLYAAASDCYWCTGGGVLGGVYRSRDGGATWSLFGSGMGSRGVTSLTIDATGAVLHAGTGNGGVLDYEIAEPSKCVPGGATLCLGGGRFRVETEWRVPSQGTHGSGVAVPLTADTGYFWFFDSSNVEVVVKVLDGCGINQREWVFAGGLTNVEVTLRVTDTRTGDRRTYRNPAGAAFQPIQDTDAFPDCDAGVGVGAARSLGEALATAALSPPSSPESGPCIPDASSLCVNGGRFRVRADWQVPSRGTSGQGTAVRLTGDTGYFWFFGASNVELVVKVLAGCWVDGHFWVFAGGLTDVGVTLTVTDTKTGEVRTYVNPPDTAFLPIQDTAAFTACP